MSGRTRLALVTPFPPRSDAPHGGGRITAETALHLADRFELSLLALRRADEPPVDPVLAARCARVEEVPRVTVGAHPGRLWHERRRIGLTLRRWPGWAVGASVAGLRTRLAEIVRSERPDVVQVEFLALADALTAVSGNGPSVVLVEHDARPTAAGERDGWRRVRRAAARRADGFVAFSEEDAAVVREDAGGRRVVVIRPGLDPPPAGGVGTTSDVLFVGGYDHPPNAASIEWLAREIHPRIRARHPAATLRVVGEGVPATLEVGGIVLVGRVADLDPVVERAAVVVAPVLDGGGVRIKVLDALGRGKAVVATRRAVEGLDVVDGEHLIVRDDGDSFADVVAELLDDPARRARLGVAARRWAETALAWDRVVDRYAALYEELAGRA